ncbi:MAG: metallophosphoesterase [Candidatus Bathyarchaeia archaeon]
MLLGMISDTHDRLEVIDRAVRFFNEQGVGLVAHAGDWCAPFALLRFMSLKARLKGVFGNVDGERGKLSENASKLGFELADLVEFESDGVRCVVIHGADERVVNALAKCGDYGLIIRGHRHEQLSQTIGSCLVVNPGEACGYLTGASTAATLDTATMKVQFHKL